MSHHTPNRIERIHAKVDCTGKKAPEVFDRFRRDGKEFIVTSVRKIPWRRREKDGTAPTHEITYSELPR